MCMNCSIQYLYSGTLSVQLRWTSMICVLYEPRYTKSHLRDPECANVGGPLWYVSSMNRGIRYLSSGSLIVQMLVDLYGMYPLWTVVYEISPQGPWVCKCWWTSMVCILYEPWYTISLLRVPECANVGGPLWYVSSMNRGIRYLSSGTLIVQMLVDLYGMYPL